MVLLGNLSVLSIEVVFEPEGTQCLHILNTLLLFAILLLLVIKALTSISRLLVTQDHTIIFCGFRSDSPCSFQTLVRVVSIVKVISQSKLFLN